MAIFSVFHLHVGESLCFQGYMNWYDMLQQIHQTTGKCDAVIPNSYYTKPIHSQGCGRCPLGPVREGERR